MGHIRAAADALGGASVLLVQLEAPVDVVLTAAEFARVAAARILFDSGPAMPVPDLVDALAVALAAKRTLAEAG